MRPARTMLPAALIDSGRLREGSGRPVDARRLAERGLSAAARICSSIVDGGPHLVSVPGRPVVALRQPRRSPYSSLWRAV